MDSSAGNGRRDFPKSRFWELFPLPACSSRAELHAVWGAGTLSPKSPHPRRDGERRPGPGQDQISLKSGWLLPTHLQPLPLPLSTAALSSEPGAGLLSLLQSFSWQGFTPLPGTWKWALSPRTPGWHPWVISVIITHPWKANNDTQVSWEMCYRYVPETPQILPCFLRTLLPLAVRKMGFSHECRNTEKYTNSRMQKHPRGQ